ncbi:hypothetical protein Pint_03141 [Pistacia integerrima]|uniref:Uncharacterized protein n=1 Tax=Pistacia integerrima TaxID=434235 RepID=A0ACC0ZFB2_9ROSI|nr:hypothetical protein Pint_03141 [Pistacia integerrima]
MHWQWEKHGTCSSPVTGDEYSYFLTTLNVYFKYNVTKVLNEAGYFPSNTEKYPRGGIVSAIQNAFHTTPKLVCSKGDVEELHLCFYKDFKLRDCAASKSSCPKYVSLPAYSSRGKFLQFVGLHGDDAAIPCIHPLGSCQSVRVHVL